jgi:hypothetical protein
MEIKPMPRSGLNPLMIRCERAPDLCTPMHERAGPVIETASGKPVSHLVDLQPVGAPTSFEIFWTVDPTKRSWGVARSARIGERVGAHRSCGLRDSGAAQMRER